MLGDYLRSWVDDDGITGGEKTSPNIWVYMVWAYMDHRESKNS